MCDNGVIFLTIIDKAGALNECVGGILIPSKCKKTICSLFDWAESSNLAFRNSPATCGHVVWEVQSHESYEKLL